LVLHIQQDVQAAQRTRGEAENVDETKCLALEQGADGGFEIAFEHGGTVFYGNVQFVANDMPCK
jgi:hypothetical protein